MALMKKFNPRVGIGLGVVQSVVGTATVRDLRKRDSSEIRGPKFIWYLWGGTNLLGSALYWTVGRKRAPKAGATTAAPAATQLP